MNASAGRSSFVTVVAWVFIVLSGFGTLISILQNVMVQTLFNNEQMHHAMQAPPPGAPPFVGFMLGHFQLLFLAVLLVFATTLVASIGLLQRRNWARLLFVGLMLLAIAWNLGGLVLQFGMFSSMQQQFSNAPRAPDMHVFFITIAVGSAVFALGFCCLFGWIAKQLLSPPIAAEFR